MSAPNDNTPSPEQKAVKTVDGVVAHGRSVMDADGRRVGPGGKVALPAAEIHHLRSLGFLLGAKEEFVAARPGPNLAVSDGPTVRLAS